MTADAQRRSQILCELEAEYEILRELGRGGMAVVYLARARATGREVAIKVIRASYLEDGEAVARFERETSLLTRLQHPSIVPVLEVKQLSDGSLALVMERVPGRTLKRAIGEDGAFGFQRAEAVLVDVACALAHAHAHGVVHRDVKPENIFLDETNRRALLADFGIARPIHGDTSLTLTGMAIGTPTYMSPEQIDGRELDGRSDLYSLGVVAWEMLAGQRPWAGESIYGVIYRQKHDELAPLDSLRPGIPAGLLVAIEGLLAKDPADRWPSAEAFLAQLRATPPPPRRPRARAATDGVAEETQTLQFRRVSQPSGDRPAARRKTRAAIAAAAGAALATLVAVAMPHGNGGEARPTAATLAADSLHLAERTTAETTRSPQRSAESTRIPDTARQRVATLTRADTLARGRPAAEPARGGDSTPTITFRTREPAPTASTLREAPRPPVIAAAASSPPTQPPSPLTASTTDRPPAEPPARAAARFTIVAGGVHTCMLADDGRAFCWGGNERGQLGTGGTTPADGPTRIAGEMRFVSIAPGMSHTCAIARGGDVYCWGANDHGQLGDGSAAPHTVPAKVAGVGGATGVFLGLAHSCALARGGVFCWGANDHGQLGIGAVGDRSTPARVADGGRFSTLALGWAHSCALTDNGMPYCWGENSSGQLGDGTTTNRTTPVAVTGAYRFTTISAGSAHTCGLTPQGGAYCWGRNTFGQLGDGTTVSQPRPVRVAGSASFVGITTGGVHTCALTAAGVAYCWGRNNYGQLGEGSTTDRATPVRVDGTHTFASIRALGAHTCGTTVTGENFCWGYNAEGQLGDGTRVHRAKPVYVEKPEK